MTGVSRIAAESVRRTLEDVLPESGRVGVVGDDATTAWLADRGYAVVRIVPQSATRDARHPAERAGVTDRVRVVGGTPDHPPIVDEAFDAVCWLGDGPSAYPSGGVRRDALRAIVELVPEQGRVVVAGLGRIGALRLALSREPSGLSGAAVRLFEDGRFDADRLGGDVSDPDVVDPTASGADSTLSDTEQSDAVAARLPFHGYRIQEFESELVNANLVVERVIGLDGLLVGTDSGDDDLSTTALSKLARIARTAGRERPVADSSFRLLAVCRRKRDRSLDTEPTVIS